MARNICLLWIITFLVGLCFALGDRPATIGSSPADTLVGIEQVLDWLPADTESIAVARGPFEIGSFTPGEDSTDRAVSDKELAAFFEDLPLGLLEFKNELLAKHLKGKQIVLALEGGRHFLTPTNLGEMLYEGCAIAVFASDFSGEETVFAKEARAIASGVEQIEGQQVLEFREKLEADTWTTFVALPTKRVLVVATDRKYLGEVLRRLNGGHGQRALLGNLPEWKYVNISARFWVAALR